MTEQAGYTGAPCGISEGAPSGAGTPWADSAPRCGAPCGGSCGGGACGAGGLCGSGACSLLLTAGELALLRRFGEIPFWPLGRRADREEGECREEGVPAGDLRGLVMKGLVRQDEDLPLANFDYAAYGDCAHRGSMALTAAGQQVLELLEIRGVES